MAIYYKYTPCPDSTGTLFYSNEAPAYPGPSIRFDLGTDLLQYGKCFEITLVDLEVPPTPLVSINWTTVVYSFWNDKCSSCVEQLPCGDCPPGYILIDGECILTEIIPANYTGGLVPVVEGDADSAYTKFGLRLYPDISGLTLPLYGYGYADNPGCIITIPYSVTDDNGAGVVVTPLLSSVKSKLWGCDNTIPTCQTGTTISNRGRLMTTGIWSPGYPDNVELSFEFCVNIETTKQYLIGIAGDNKVKIYVDTVLHVFLDVDGVDSVCAQAVTTPFTSWHVFPITLNAGSHVIKLSGLNLGSDASFGAEIYDIDLATFQSTLTTPASGSPNCGNVPADIDPYVIFSTKDYIGQSIPDPNNPGVWTCPDGYTLDVCNGIPQCTKVTAVPATPCYNVYSLQSCCGGQPVIIYFLNDYLEEDGVYIYTASTPYGDLISPSCYTATSYSYTGTEAPPFPQGQISDFSLVEQGCEAPICGLLCLPCECRSFRLVNLPPLPPDYPYDYYPLNYIDCDLTAQVYQIPLDGSWGAPDCMRSYFISIDGIETTSNGLCIVDVSDTGLKSDCPTYYELINCADPNNRFCVTNDLSTELLAGYVLVLSNNPTQCWSIGQATTCVNPVTISYSLYYSDCTECLSQNIINYELINCNLPEQVIYTSTDLSSYIGLTVSLTEYPDDCWEVNILNSIIPSDIPVHVSNSFVNCVECSQPTYLLQDCSTVNPELNIITSTDLSAYVGQVITLESCPDICWQVSVSDSAIGEQIVNIGSEFSTCEECMASMPCVCNTVTNNTIGALKYDYIDCDGMLQTMVVNGKVTSPKTCMVKWLTTDTTSTFNTYGTCIDQECPVVIYPKRTVRPGYNTPGCSPEEYERVMCNFSEGYYRDVMVQAYGITPCCGEDDYLWEIRKELIELKAIEDPNYKCLTLGCGCTTTAYGLTPCVPTPVVCHTYIVTIPALSSGYLHYLNCQSVPTTVQVTKTKAPYEINICGAENQDSSTIYVDNPGGVVTIQETVVICS